MELKYYIIPDALGQTLGLTRYRHGNAEDGWLVNIGDLAVYGVERAEQEGARMVALREAKDFVNRHNKHNK